MQSFTYTQLAASSALNLQITAGKKDRKTAFFQLLNYTNLISIWFANRKTAFFSSFLPDFILEEKR